MNWTEILREAGIPEPPGRQEVIEKAIAISLAKKQAKATPKSKGKPMKFLTLTAAALLAAPAQAQVTTAPGTWQTTPYCSITFIEVNTRTNQKKEVFRARCTGVNVSIKNNVNVHFSTVHPSFSKPVLSFVLAEGPYSGKHPVETAVTFLGDKDQAELNSDSGYCNISRGETLNFVTCTAASRTRPDGKFLQVLGVAGFEESLAPEIRSALR